MFLSSIFPSHVPNSLKGNAVLCVQYDTSYQVRCHVHRTVVHVGNYQALCREATYSCCTIKYNTAVYYRTTTAAVSPGTRCGAVSFSTTKLKQPMCILLCCIGTVVVRRLYDSRILLAVDLVPDINMPPLCGRKYNIRKYYYMNINSLLYSRPKWQMYDIDVRVMRCLCYITQTAGLGSAVYRPMPIINNSTYLRVVSTTPPSNRT